MLILCYGMPKSGSTLAFELVRGMLRNAGYPQEVFINDHRNADDLQGSGPGIRNFAKNLSDKKIADIAAEIGPNRKIAVKTHSAMPAGAFERMEDMQRRGDLLVVASYRDPREMCLSLLDAGRKITRDGANAFGGKADLDTAAQGVERRIRDFREWAAMKGTLRLDYDTVAFLPDDAMDKIEPVFGFTCDRAAVKQYAYKEAYTQKNKARRARYKELSPEQNAELMDRFGEFIRRVCDLDDQTWFDECRAEMMSAPC
ncbi:MAG TPA: hypothetical protein VHE09_17035 [Rhizomicrobium sp.]|nr:hypothetical protein [Rhizomicrobium sp.]